MNIPPLNGQGGFLVAEVVHSLCVGGFMSGFCFVLICSSYLLVFGASKIVIFPGYLHLSVCS